MRVHTVTKTHPAQTIAESGSKPFEKALAASAGMDAVLQATSLAAEVVAYTQTSASAWHGFAWRVINMSTDGRAEFIKRIAEALKGMKATLKDVHGAEEHKANVKRLNSATTYISKLRIIANAWNSGGTVEGLAAHFKVNDPENLGFVMLYEYAALFNKSEARGRPALALIIKVGKWLEANKLDEESSIEDKRVYAAINAVYEKHKANDAAMPAGAPAPI